MGMIQSAKFQHSSHYLPQISETKTSMIIDVPNTPNVSKIKISLILGGYAALFKER